MCINLAHFNSLKCFTDVVYFGFNCIAVLKTVYTVNEDPCSERAVCIEMIDRSLSYLQ